MGAFNNIAQLVSKGYLFIAIYNDQGWISKYWLNVKKIYNTGSLGKVLMVILHFPYLYIFRSLIKCLQGRSLKRGMSLWYDMLDWLGGYPFEVAKPEVVINFFQSRGYELKELKTCGGRLGCNEFIFYRNN
jgi:2-polyprenyl-6-hydroxyphenyl methylase/3-demethylubiquinone-9 3-methyltransferase